MLKDIKFQTKIPDINLGKRRAPNFINTLTCTSTRSCLLFCHTCPCQSCYNIATIFALVPVKFCNRSDQIILCQVPAADPLVPDQSINDNLMKCCYSYQFTTNEVIAADTNILSILIYYYLLRGFNCKINLNISLFIIELRCFW